MSLNEQSELILYEGYRMLGKDGEIIIKNVDGGVSFLEDKIQKGDITEAGIEIPKTAAQKWLGGFGKFMMMGGFMVVLIVIVALIIGISLATKNC